ncbi:hypothetical protein [Promicromonospora iranensis]|uniref:O-antigen ligase-like membrane protein n=1 Tax=Promicromonospora iranensis TaxID=1105144 RepID=A0ABU2CM83_9MICO|nr:hypothetical protein [Promicromonospora iranensis]MDR7382450.1 hypothetical protein [Promicromonospora iranensis]
MSGGLVDRVALLGLGAVTAALLVLLLRSRPQAAVVLWAVVLCFVPYWIGVTAGAYFPAVSAVAVLVVVALAGRARVSLAAADVVMVLVVVLVGISLVAGLGQLPSTFALLAEWVLGYLLGRVVGGALPLERVYAIVSVVLALAAALACVEAATGQNLFVQVPGSGGGGHSVWSPLQERGGLLRAEGAFGHSIALGGSCALGIPLAFASNLGSRAKAIVVVLLHAGAVVSFSRLGIGTAVIGLVLCLLLLGRTTRPRLRGALAGALVVGGALALPTVARVFEAAGSEATDSAEYRGSLLELVPAIRLLGTSGVYTRDASGVVRWDGFRSIDSAVVLAGLQHGVLPLVLLISLWVAAAWLVVSGRATGPGVALVAQAPSFVAVALITQYAILVWFVAGLAVAATARPARPRPTEPPTVRPRALSTLTESP